MQLYDPTVTAPARGFARAPAIADLRGLTIGLLDNGKVNADNLLMRTAELYVERHGCSIAPMSDKHNASGAEDSPAHISIGAQHEAVSTPSIGLAHRRASFTEERSATFTSPLVTSSPLSIVGSTPASTAATAPAERASA